MRSNPVVCVEVDEVRSHTDWASVVVSGRYEEFPDTPAFSAQRQRVQALLEKRALWWQTAFAAAQTRGRFDRDIPIFYGIRVEKISGRCASPDPVEASFDRS
jgi:nitroimidazol reductase NimA-like FMN-containing flavoprotein (pyridoxamine 5'-phosphate oxidase superfamily)